MTWFQLEVLPANIVHSIKSGFEPMLLANLLGMNMLWMWTSTPDLTIGKTPRNSIHHAPPYQTFVDAMCYIPVK